MMEIKPLFQLMQSIIFPVRKPRGCWEAPVAQRDAWEAFDKSTASDLEQDSVFFWGGHLENVERNLWKMWNIYEHL